jgi:hypothetical protein
VRSRKRRDGGRTSIHLLAETRRHLVLVQRGRRREPGLDNRIVNEALAAHCTDITEARTERGEEPGYRFYTARWAPAGPPPSRTPAAAPRWDRKPAADPAAPFLPMEPGEWVPRVPLRHDRAVIATRVLTGRLRTARRTGRAAAVLAGKTEHKQKVRAGSVRHGPSRGQTPTRLYAAAHSSPRSASCWSSSALSLARLLRSLSFVSAVVRAGGLRGVPPFGGMVCRRRLTSGRG